MFLIDSPFVSDFLIDTIKEHNIDVVSTNAAKELINDDTISWISEEDAIKNVRNDPKTPIYTNSENALSWIANNLGDTKRYNQVELFKDKVKFRELIKSLFPDFFFTTVKLTDVQNLSINDIAFPFVIKPSVGFFSIGVHVVKNESDWDTAKKELNFNSLKSIFPSDVLDTSTFIIEEFIQGEEFAVDFYYNNEGEAVILNILHHMFSSGTDTSDRVYSTSKDIILQYKNSIGDFLNSIGKRVGLKNFPAHAELRIDANGHINPIEINPLRFGGWCTTGDLLGVALGFNSYECYCHNQKPNWEQIFKNRTDKKFSIVVLNNNSGFLPAEIKKFKYDQLALDFENPLIIRELDVEKYSVFGFMFTETSLNNEGELDKILVSDLKKFIITK
jgi:hypothetical protein